LSRIKGQDRLLRALALVAKRPDVPPFCVQLVGGPIATEREYPDQLAALAHELAPVPVTFTGPLARPELVPVINDCAVAVNFSPPGSFDKAALESMLVGKPTLVMNADFLPVLGPAAEQLYLPYEADDEKLAGRLAALLALSPAERAALGGELRERVVAQHSLDSLMDSIVDVIAEAVKT